MTTEPTTYAMTEAEVASFVAKTRAWWEQLTPNEQALVYHAFRTADDGEADVQGYSEFDNALIQLLFAGDPQPALRLAMNALLVNPAPPPLTPAPGPGGMLGGRTAMN